MSPPAARILLLAPDLSKNAVATAWQFKGALEGSGHRVTLAGPASGPRWLPLSQDLEEAVETGPPALLGVPPILNELARDADALYAFKALPTSFGVGLRLARRFDLPLALHLDDWDAGFLRGDRRLRRLWWAAKDLGNPVNELWLRAMEALIPCADVVTVASSALKRRFGGVVVRQGVDTRRFGPDSHPGGEARRRLGIPEGRPMVLFLGTPRRHKGLANLLSLEGMRDSVWIVGMTPGSEGELGLDSRHLDGAHFVPPVSYDEAAWYLAACDVFVVPQEDTPFAAHQVPAKILQAMAVGAAVVTTDVGDAAEILGGTPSAGVVVPPGDSEALRGAIDGLLGDPDRRAALAREAVHRSEARFGWKAMGPVLANVVASLVEDRVRRHGRGA